MSSMLFCGCELFSEIQELGYNIIEYVQVIHVLDVLIR